MAFCSCRIERTRAHLAEESTARNSSIIQPKHAVDKDLPTRITTLLLSRNERRPPITPHVSEEHLGRATDSILATISSKMDASMMKNTFKPSLPRSLSKSVDGLDETVASATPYAIPKSRHFQRSSSTDFRAPYDASPALRTRIARRVSVAASDVAKRSWLKMSPDAKQADMTVSTRLDLTSLPRKRNSGYHHLHRPYLCTFDDSLIAHADASNSWPGRELMAEPADLVCFLAGCSPGQLNCKKQHKLSTSSARILSQADGAGAKLEAEKNSNGNQAESNQDFQKSNPSSMVSKVSRTSASRHHLLKSLVSETLIDSGLPVPPVLTTTSGRLDLPMSPTQPSPSSRLTDNKDETTNVRNTHTVIDTLSVVQPKELLSSANDIVGLHQALPTSPRTERFPSFRDDIALYQDAETLHDVQAIGRYYEVDKQPKAILVQSATLDTLPNRSTINSSRAAYWGFEPTVKSIVNDAVSAVVQNVVSEAILPRGAQKSKAARAYRRAIADSLAEAAKDADTRLRRSSIWRSSEFLHTHGGYLRERCHRLTCLDDTSIEHCNSIASTPGVTSQILKPAITWRGNDCVVCPRPSDRKLSNTALNVFTKAQSISEALKARLPPLSTPPSSRNENGGTFGAPDALVPGWDSSRDDLENSKHEVESPGLLDRFPLRMSKPCKAVSLKSQRSQSESSNHSLRSCVSANDYTQEDSSLIKRALDDSDAGSLSYMPMKDSLRRRSTVKWLRDLLMQGGTYESRLTALPPRTRRGQDCFALPAKLQASADLPAKIDVTPDIEDQHRKKPTLDLQYKQASIPEGLSKTINELEELLNEALSVARKVNDNKRLGTYSKPGDHKPGSKASDEHSLLESMHESLCEADSDVDIDQNTASMALATVSIVENPQSTIHPAGWPPTGRISTPYPPNTQPPSITSVPEEVLQQHSSSTTSSQVKDPATADVDHRLRSNPSILRAGRKRRDGGESDFQNLEPLSPGRLSVPNRTTSFPVSKNTTVKMKVSKPQVSLNENNDSMPLPKLTPKNTTVVCKKGHSEDEHQAMQQRIAQATIPSRARVRDHIIEFKSPPISARESSKDLKRGARGNSPQEQKNVHTVSKESLTGELSARLPLMI